MFYLTNLAVYMHGKENMLWFNFILGSNFIILYFWVWYRMIKSLKQREINFWIKNKNWTNTNILRKLLNGQIDLKALSAGANQA